jgi:hypothetical protein
MNKHEVLIWKYFLERNEDKYYNYKYDVLLPVVNRLPENFPEKWKIVTQQLTGKRIDVVMEDQKLLYIVEVRPDAKQGAIGNLILYKHLYSLRYNPEKPVILMLVTNTYNSEIHLALREINAHYIVV